MATAEAMLDEKYEALPTQPKDQNTYTLGRIESHNIAIACLPLGVCGKPSASIVGLQIERALKSIRYSHMVGIRGGVPSKDADIRLGNVVCDHGKTVSEGRFQRTGMLNNHHQSSSPRFPNAGPAYAGVCSDV
ncbi:conserved hypothetical protein [Talaromyces marneffei ATCC 18224]|uniref:Nucleoside phosphorylase domain-containing protein n=1 Tax=Talaromyces marneffei (strain ATCC 18224 / CBS 334.59 / QM 7333) TaxID=441960 RepID=B6QJV0_TALMQ|nr:conserved hypothetical protein [Talaromyces marneffei ATCC 18224]